MPSMQTRKALPPEIFDIAVPVDPQIVALLEDNILGLSGVDINAYVDGKPRRRNSIVGLGRGHDHKPTHSPHEIAELVARIQHQAWLSQTEGETPAQPLRFQIQALVQRKGEPRPIKVTVGDCWYNGEEFFDDPDDELDDERNVGPEVAALLRVCSVQERMIDKLADLHAAKDQVFLDQQERLVGVATAGSEGLEKAVPLFVSAFQNQLAGEKLKYEEAKAREEVASSERKWKYLWDKVEKLPKMGQDLLGLAQLASTMRGAFGRGGPMGGPRPYGPPPGFGPGAPGGPAGPVPGAAAPQGSPASGPPPGPGAPTGPASGPDASAPGPQPEEPPPFSEEEIDNPLATLVAAVHHSLRADQLRTLTKLLTKTELELWWTLCESQTDEQVYAAYAALKAKTGAKLLKLRSHLDEIQQQQLMGVVLTCEQGAPEPEPAE